jgi:hypothetical protein
LCIGHRPSQRPSASAPPAPLDLAALAQHLGAELYRGVVSLVDPEHRIVVAAPTTRSALRRRSRMVRTLDRLPLRLTVYGIGPAFTAGEELSTPVRGAVESARRELHGRLGKWAAAGRPGRDGGAPGGRNIRAIQALAPIGNYLTLSFEHARVGDAMRPRVLTCDPQTAVAQRMASGHVHRDRAAARDCGR